VEGEGKREKMEGEEGGRSAMPAPAAGRAPAGEEGTAAAQGEEREKQRLDTMLEGVLY
jgi:hypothetical protein